MYLLSEAQNISSRSSSSSIVIVIIVIIFLNSFVIQF